METEVISRENVKPISPTPNHLKTHHLSLVDQITQPFLFPIVLYFPSTRNPDQFTIHQKTNTLKHSLSILLTQFYPFAGRIKDDNISIDCNDEGVPLTVTKTNGTLADFLRKPNPIATRSHLPCDRTFTVPAPTSHVAMIQINHFECGGMAIGAVFLHTVVDGTAVSIFFRAWADTAQGSGELAISCPGSHMVQSFFPKHNLLPKESRLFHIVTRYLRIGKTIMRRYVFNASTLSKLKTELLVASPETSNPTRVEIASAFIWKCFMAASIANKKKISMVSHVVNLRRRANPPLPDHSFGNILWMAPASCTNKSDTELQHLIAKIRKAIGNIDGDFVSRMQGDDYFSGYCRNTKATWDEFLEDADYLSFTSWCNFGLYEIDYGWGKPVWVTRCDAGSDSETRFLNWVLFMDTKDSGGVEVWVTLDEKYMKAFDSNEELRAVASVDPSPLHLPVS